MPKGPKGERRPADVIGNAVHVMRIATGEIEDTIPGSANDASGKNPNAVALGRLGGQKGGKARADKLSAEKRTEIATKAAKARWRT